MNTVSDQRKRSARKHSSRTWTCVCGKVCKGNGGKSAHKRACGKYRAMASARGFGVPVKATESSAHSTKEKS